MKNPRIYASFYNNILSVTFLDNAVVDVSDLQEMYSIADQRSEGKKYGVVFESEAHYEVTDEAIRYISENPSNKNILGKAYVVNHQEARTKTKFHLMFDHPSVKPFVFKTKDEAMEFLKGLMKG